MKLSIITINLNNSIGLQKTIESVRGQTFRDFEYIIIDGGSKDNSLKVIKDYSSNITLWISEPDKGIYDAMNKGIAVAKGDYLLMLNSGDKLINDQILNKIFNENNFNFIEDILYGDVKWEYKGDLKEIRTFPETLDFHFFLYKSLGHQSTFINRNVHKEAGLYDANLKLTSDWKFFILAICKYKVSCRHIPTVISICDSSGLSWNPNYFSIRVLEREKVFAEHFPLYLKDYQVISKANKKNHKFIYFLKKQKYIIKKYLPFLVNIKNLILIK